MRKLLSVSKKQVTILITMAVLASVSVWYYVGYIPNKEQALNEQHFRWLQKTDNNIRDKIVAYDTLLSNLLQAYTQDTLSADYIDSYNIDNAPMYAYTTPLITFKPIKVGIVATDKKASRIVTRQVDTSSIQFKLAWDSVTNKLNLSATKAIIETNKKYTVLMTCDFERFIKPLLVSGLFEHYVIFYGGNYIYEDFHSGLGYEATLEDSLLKTGKAMTGSNIIDQKVGGVNYKIFLQPINFFNGKKLLIAGLLSQQSVDAEKKQLPPGVALLAITIGLGILLFLPWIKLHFQGKYDKTSLRDAAQSVLVAKLLMALIVLLFFTYNYPFRYKNDVHSKRNLANAIDTAFNQELSSAYNCLSKFDSLMNKNKMFYDVINLGTGNVKSKVETRKSDTILKTFCKNIKYYEVNWLDENGTTRYNWSTSNQFKPLINASGYNYKDRDYFKNIKKNNTLTLQNKPDSFFTIDQVISKTSGTFRTILCKKSYVNDSSVLMQNESHPSALKQQAVKYVVLSFTLKNLDSVIMPAGYNFAIIDNGGAVRYDSRPERNLNENLLDEFSNNEALKDALAGRFKETFETQYYEDDYSVLVRPLQNLPYFIVIMSDKSFPESAEIETFSFTWGMTLTFLFLVALDIFILIMASARRSLFRKQYFVTSWLWPRSNAHYEYFIAGAGNTILIIILIGIFWLRPFGMFQYLSYLFILIFCVPLLTIFLNIIFLYKYKIDKNETYLRYKVRCTKWSTLLLALLNIFAIASLNGFAYFGVLGFEFFVFIIGWLVIKYYLNHSTQEQPLAKKKSYIRSYTFMIFTRVIITSAIPVVFFYTTSYNFETNLLARYRMYDFAMQLKQNFPAGITQDTLRNHRNIYCDGAWIKTIDVVKNCALCDSGETNPKLSATEANTGKLFNSFGFYLEDVSNVNNDNFYLPASADSKFCFTNFFDSTLYHSTGNRLCVKEANDTAKNRLQITSANLNYYFPSLVPVRGFMFWVMLLAILFCFACVILKVVKKVFSLDLRKILVWKGNCEIVQQLMNTENHPVMWVTGLPTNEIVNQLMKSINISEKSFLLDFNEIKIDDTKPKELELQQLADNNFLLQLKTGDKKKSEWDDIKLNFKTESFSCVIMLHIDSHLDNAKITTEKLDCIKTALQGKKKIVLVSDMHPLELYKELSAKVDVTKYIKNDMVFNLLNTIFKNSDVITLPLIENKNDEIIKDPLHMFLNEETKYTEYLKGLRSAVLLQGISNESKRFQEDKLTLHIQSLANNFYIDIWQSLSADEKFILNDLAADGLVNINNTFAVALLINKGLVIEKDGHLHIFNRSFRNFIVTSVNDKELAHLQMLENKHSNWSNLQAPLLLIVLAVFIFLAIAQEGLYSKVISIISGMAAGIPALLKIISMLGVESGKEVRTEKSA